MTRARITSTHTRESRFMIFAEIDGGETVLIHGSACPRQIFESVEPGDIVFLEGMRSTPKGLRSSGRITR